MSLTDSNQYEYERCIVIESSDSDAIEKVLKNVRRQIEQVQQANKGALDLYTFTCSWRLRRKVHR